MKGTVKEVRKQKISGRYDGVVLVINQEQDGSERSYNIFKNMDIYSKVTGLKSGDFVELSLEKNARGYWNLVDVDIIAKPSTSNSNNQSYGDVSGGSWGARRQELSVEQTCLKAATELHCTILANGTYYKKGVTPTIIEDEINNTKLKMLAAIMPEVAGDMLFSVDGEENPAGLPEPPDGDE